MENKERLTLAQAFEKLKADENKPLEENEFIVITKKTSCLAGSLLNFTEMISASVYGFIQNNGQEEGEDFACSLKAGIDMGLLTAELFKHTPASPADSVAIVQELFREMIFEPQEKESTDEKEQEDETQA